MSLPHTERWDFIRKYALPQTGQHS
jgi:hypothetical protein